MSLAAQADKAASPNAAALDPRTLFAPMLGGAAFAGGAFWPGMLRDGDTWWHIKAGEWIFAHRAVPHADPFSYSMLGHPWVAHEWLSEVVMAGAFRAGGWAGLALLGGLCFGATMAVIGRRLALSMNDAVAALLALGMGWLLAPYLTARPQLIALPLVALWADRLLAAREAGRAPPLALAMAMVVWANLHGGFVFGLALIAPFALEAVVAAQAGVRLQAARAWGAFAAASVAAALATPFFVQGILFPFHLASMQSLGRIGEWQAPNLGAFAFLPATMLAIFALALTTSARLNAIRAALLVALMAETAAHVRHEALLAIVGAMILAPMIGDLTRKYAPVGGTRVASAWVFAIPLVAFVAIARLLHPVERADDPVSPITALAAVPAKVRALHVLNDYDFGGYLIAQGVAPYVDGRTDLYGDSFMSDFIGLADSPEALHAELEKDAIGWTIFRADRKIVPSLDREPGWRRLFTSESVVVHVRDLSVR